MDTSTEIIFEMDETVKEQFEAVLEDLGMNITTGLNVLVRAVVRHGGFPFELNQGYKNPYNMERINHSRSQAEQGNVIIKTAEELGLNDED